MTLGTGVGCALFRNRRLLLHLELGQHRARKGNLRPVHRPGGAGCTIGPSAGTSVCARPSRRCMTLTNCDRLYIGGGNARKIAFELPPQVRIVSNTAGITGGVRLWEPELDELFGERSRMARMAAAAEGRNEGTHRRRGDDRHDRHHRQRSHRAHDHAATPTTRSCCWRKGERPRRSKSPPTSAAARSTPRWRWRGSASTWRPSSSSARMRAPRRCLRVCCRRACRRAGPCATAARRPVPRCSSPRTTATPPSSPSAAPTRCSRRPTCAMRPSRSTSSTSRR